VSSTRVCSLSRSLGLRFSRTNWVAVLAAATIVASSTVAFADNSTVINTDFFNVNGTNGTITVNQGTNNVSSGSLQITAANQGGNGAAGTTTRSLNANTITFNPSGSTSGNFNVGAGAVSSGTNGNVSQQFNFGALSYLTPGTYTLNASGTVTGTQTNNQTVGGGPAGDGPFGLSAGVNVNRTIVVNNVAPTTVSALQNGNNSNIVVNQGSTVALQMQASDPGNDTIAFTINGGGAGSVAGGPGSTRTSSVVNVSYFTPGTFTNTYAANDGFGGTAGATRQVQVLNVAPQNVTLNPSATTINEGQSLNIYSTATDPGNDTLTFTIDGNNAGSIAGAPGSTRTSNTLSLGPYSQTGGPSSSVVINGSVNDGNGGITAAAPLTITVLNLPPVVTSFGENGPRTPAPLLFTGGDLISFIGTATDPGNDTLTYAFSFDGGGLGPYTPSNSTAPMFFAVGSHTATFSVSDGDGGFASQVYNFEVVPEPATIALAGLGGALALAMFRRKRSK